MSQGFKISRALRDYLKNLEDEDFCKEEVRKIQEDMEDTLKYIKERDEKLK